MTWLKDMQTFLFSPYLHYWWWLVAGYLACWGLAWALGAAGQTGATIVQRCRQAWAWALVVHLVAVAALALLWWQRFGFFKSFYAFLPFYVVLALIDLILITRLFAASRT